VTIQDFYFFFKWPKKLFNFFLKLMGCWDGHDLNSYEKNYINHHDSRSPFKANDFIHYVRLSLSPIDTFCVLSLCGSPRSFTLDGGYHVQQQQPVFLVLTFFFVILTRSLTTRASVPHDFTSWGSPSLNKKKREKNSMFWNDPIKRERETHTISSWNINNFLVE
jgi:hypothetical protein